MPVTISTSPPASPTSPGGMNSNAMGTLLDSPIGEGISAGNKGDVVILDQVERIKRFGIECLGPKGDGISFLAGKWVPGGEYVQKLIVRNVSTSVKKVKYTLPSTRYFSLAYPETIILSPGMFREIDVVFRPVKLEPYDDTVYFKVLESGGGGEVRKLGGFHVPVKAFIDKLSVSAPFGVDLGYCPTYQTSLKTFRLINDGEHDAPFRWVAPFPFSLSPMEGVLKIGEYVDVTVSIFPTDASVYVSQALCYIGEGIYDAIIDNPVLATRFSAIGKYAFISLSETEVHFGEVVAGSKEAGYKNVIKKEVLLRNTSVVPCTFTLIRHDTDRDEVFSIFPQEGEIPALGEVAVIVTYSPLAMGVFSLDRYTFLTPGMYICMICIICICIHMHIYVEYMHIDVII